MACKLILYVYTGTDPGVYGVVNHPPWALQLHNFQSKFLSNSISEGQIIKISGGIPQDSLTRSFSSYMLSVIYKLCVLGHTHDNYYEGPNL